MQALEQAAADAAEYNGNYAVIAQPLDFLRQLDWRLEPPTREDLLHAAALCHLVYWWRGPEHRSWETLKKDAKLDSGATEALQQLTPRNKETSGASFSAEAVQASSAAQASSDALAELAPPSEAKGGGIAYEFQDRDQVHKCVKAVSEELHDEARVALWLDAIHCGVIVEPARVVVVFRGTVDADEMRDDAKFLRLVALRPKAAVDRAMGKVPLVHAGFVAHLGKQGCGERLLATVLKEVAARQRLRKPCAVLLAGHSLGAAAATLLALQLDGSSLRMRITLVTFGSPRVGNRHFQRAFDASARLRHYRVQNELDPIARGPWWLPFPGTYRHTGHHVWLDASPSWWRLPGCCNRHRPIVCRWRRDGAIWSAARPVNLLVYPFRWLWNENAADFRTHQIGGKFKKGYLVNLEKAAWDVE